NRSAPVWNTRLSVPGEYRLSSDGSSWTLSWKPATRPSPPTTRAVIRGAPSTDALGAEDDRDPASPRGGGHRRPGALQDSRIGRRHALARRAVTGDETFREADHGRLLGGRVVDGPLGQSDRVVRTGRERQVGEGDADGRGRAHGTKG